jgi:hypothetical protein
MKVWILEKYGDPDPEAFETEDLGLKSYYDYIEERTSGMEHDAPEFEWQTDSCNELKRYSCYCYGEFVARLIEVEMQ